MFSTQANYWLIFPENIGESLSIDEVALSKGELYTILAIITGTMAEQVILHLYKIPSNKVKEITLDIG